MSYCVFNRKKLYFNLSDQKQRLTELKLAWVAIMTGDSTQEIVLSPLQSFFFFSR